MHQSTIEYNNIYHLELFFIFFLRTWNYGLRLKKPYASVTMPPALVRVPTNDHLSRVPVVHGAMGCGQKNFTIVWRYHQLLSGFVAIGYLPQVSRQSRLSANDKGDNEMIQGAVHIWYLPYSWENPRKTSARRPSLKAMRPVIPSYGVPYPKWGNCSEYFGDNLFC